MHEDMEDDVALQACRYRYLWSRSLSFSLLELCD